MQFDFKLIVKSKEQLSISDNSDDSSTLLFSPTTSIFKPRLFFSYATLHEVDWIHTADGRRSLPDRVLAH